MLDWSRNQLYAAVLIAEILFWGLFFGIGFQGWIPAFPLIATGLAILNVVILFGAYFTGGESMPGFETTTKQQLTDRKARELAEYMLIFGEYGLYPAMNQSGVDPEVSPSDDKEDATRLFAYEFEPLNFSGRATLLLDLEQDLSVEIGDKDSLEKASQKIQNKQIVKSWMVEDYVEAVETAKENLGRSASHTITTITETDWNGSREIRKVPADLPGAGEVTQNQANSDGQQTES